MIRKISKVIVEFLTFLFCAYKTCYRKKFLIFGDSHSLYFDISSEERNKISNDIKIKTISIPGASISGFGKRKSTLNSRKVFLTEMKLEKPSYVVFALGQVDIELGFYYKKIIKKEISDIDEYITLIIDKYIQAIVDLRKESIFRNVQIVIKGINNTCLTNDINKAIEYTSRIITENIEVEKIFMYKKLLIKHFPSAQERVANHYKFNKAIQKACEEENFFYFDINDEICSKKTTFIIDNLIPNNGDHHIINSANIRKLHIEKLLKCINSPLN